MSSCRPLRVTLTLRKYNARWKRSKEVRKIHDLHIWTLTSNLFTLTAHAVVNGDHDQHALLNSWRRRFTTCFGIDHITIQLEPQDRQAGEPQHF
jgi:cobalt-zinc-cadmium efflux system protein